MEMDISCCFHTLFRDLNGLQSLPAWMGVRGRESKSVQVSFDACRWPGINKRCISALLLVERRAPPNSHLLPTNRVLTSESSLAFVPKVVALELLVCSQVPRPRLFPRFCHVLGSFAFMLPQNKIHATLSHGL